MKVLLKSVGVLFCLAIFYSCDSSSSKSKELSDFIPEEVSVVFKIKDFEALKSDLKNNGFLSQIKKTAPYSFFSNNILFKYLHPDSNSLLCVSSISNKTQYTFIAKLKAGLFELDSIPEKSIENLSYKKHPLQLITINEEQLYTTVKDSVFVASSSKILIQNILSGKSIQNPIFKKIQELNKNADLTTIFPVNSISINDSISVNLASWAALDVEVLPNALTASGVVLEQDSIPQLLSVFKGLVPQQNDIAKVTPIDALSVVSITFNDFERFQNNLQQFRAIKVTDNYKSYLFESISEIGKIELPDGNAMILKSIDPTLTYEALSTYINQKENYKELEINEFNKPELFSDFLSPFLKKTAANFVFQLDEFFVFTENSELAKQIITSYLNNNCLSKTVYYQEALTQLSDESSLLIMKLNGHYSKSISNLIHSDIGNISFKKYPLAILQFSYDRDFTHINLVCKEASSTKQSIGSVSQLVNIQLENDIMGSLKFFSNHRTGGKDIIAQDITNKLYFISASGKVLWTKKLDGPILGSVEEVDILRNRKKQLAFTTKNTFYILDRTGRSVAPFPKTFRDDITQPLSVFDYDNNRNYRFIICQENELLMINNKGKTVRGFKFKKAKSDIILPPKHIRMATKDYILIAEKSGKLNILSRVGNSRVKVSKSFNFSDIPIVKEGENFVVISKDPESSGQIKNSISQSGEVRSLKLKVTAYWFAINGKTKVTLDDNLMRINGKLVELPYGIYTPPQIFSEHQKTYITITETQENKVYIYNKLGELLPGFPIFGTSSIDIGDVNKNGNLNFIVKGGAKEIVLFELQ
jgi:hypothetical protein